jgi:hypothetical protein
VLLISFLPSISIDQANGAQFSFSYMQFTNCGAIGLNGPTLANCLAQANYSSQSWTSNTSFFNITGGIQYWTVPTTGDYQITAAGAQGGGWGSNVGGKGVIETSTVSLTEGEVLRILVGQKGVTGSGNNGSGGGGSFVIRSPYDTNTAIIMIAGGGGGYGQAGGGTNMQGQTARNPTSTNSNAGSNGGGGASAANSSGGGNGFVAGANAPSSIWAAGGAGFGGNGGAYSTGATAGPKSFINGGTGGPGAPGAGGFGGGGGAGDRGAGGGGYSGGGGGGNTSYGGDGGGSYLTGSNQRAVGGANSGDGYVIIARYVPAVVSMSASTVVNYRTITSVTLNSDSPGKATFFVNNKKIAGCISLTLSGSGASYSVQCNWKPSMRGATQIRAVLSPSNGNIVTSTGISTVAVISRSGTR